MKLKILWIIALPLLAVYLTLYFLFFFQPKNGTGIIGGPIVFFALELVGNLLTVSIFSAVPALLFALIPFRQKTYNERFKTTLPLLTGIVSFMLILSFGYMAYLKDNKGFVSGPLRKYDDIQIPATLNCTSIHEGKFELDGTIIIREGNKQIETVTATGERKELIVEWLSDCEYTLVPADDRSQKLRIKITAVTPDSYGIYCIAESNANAYASFYTIKRLK